MAKRRGKNDYHIGWICALSVEFKAAIEMLDEEHPEMLCDILDNNKYRFGRIGHCNIVLVCLPAGVYGTNAAAAVATNFRRSFPRITANLMVGIGGGAPLLPHNDVRLGDVVVGLPGKDHGGILQYDFGKTIQAGKFISIGTMNMPPSILLGAVSDLQADYLTRVNALDEAIEKALASLPADVAAKFSCPSAETDRLFQTKYDHPAENESCDQCNNGQVVVRQPRLENRFNIHYGLIASGNQVMKYGPKREELSRSKDVLCFEMEAAGIVNELPTLVIRGICDYSDSHKNKEWQPYAAFSAAVFAKETVLRLPVRAPNGSTLDEAVNSESYECLRYLDATDPRNDKARYEATKDELIEKSYSWILCDPSFKAWTLNNEKPVLWVSGGAGKGKTMLTMGIIESLEHRPSESHQTPFNSVTYFFCQATDNRRNSAAAVLKGILYHLILSDKHNVLVRYLKEEYDKSEPDCLSGPNAFYVLQRVFFKIFQDQIFEEFYFLVDALDECTDGLTELLNFVSRSLMLPESSKIKWFLTSRNRPDIEERLDSKAFLRRISLEENNTQITAAVNDYINEKITHLSKSKRYSAEVFDQIQKILQERAGNTFLWIHLACKELARVKASQAISTLQKIPSGLQEFYQEMLNNIERTNTEEDTGLCRQLLSAVTLAVRPLSLSEMAIITGLPPEMNEYDMEVQVKQCGSFLIVQEKTVLFVHQSAKDFLDSYGSGNMRILGSTTLTQGPHYPIVSRCLNQLSKELKMDICDLKIPGFHIKFLKPEQILHINHLKYACCYWVHHFIESGVGERSEIRAHISNFLRKHLLHWMEALVLLGASSQIILLATALERTALENTEDSKFFYDIRRFVQYHYATIAEAPLQIYSSAILFSPKESIVAKLFSDSIPDWVIAVGGGENIDKGWGPLIKTFRTRPPVDLTLSRRLGIDRVTLIAVSVDGKYLASSPASSNSNGITIWDFTSGVILKELEGHSGTVRALAFSASTAELASASDDTSIRIWNIMSGENQLLFQGRDIISLAWLVGNNELRTTGRNFYNLGLCNMRLGLHLTIQSDFGEILCYLCKDELIAYGSESGSILIWNTNTRRLSRSFRQFDTPVTCLRASPNGSQLASGSVNGVIRLLDVHSGTLIQTFKLQNTKFPIYSIDFSPDGTQLVSVSSTLSKNKIFQKSEPVPVVNLWEISSGTVLRKQIIPPQNNDHNYFPKMSSRVIFSLDGLSVYLGVCRGATRSAKFYIWDLASEKMLVCLFEALSVSYPFAIVPYRLQFVATQGFDIMQYDMALPASATVRRTSKPGPMTMRALAISPDGKMLASIQAEPPAPIRKTRGHTIRLLNLDSNEIVWTSKLRPPNDSEVIRLEFLPDGRLLLIPAAYQMLPISLPILWATASGRLLSYPSIIYNKNVTSIAFSSDSKVAMALGCPISSTIMIWDTEDAMMTILSTHHEGFPSIPIKKLNRDQKFPPPTHTLTDHKRDIYFLQFSADGTKLMSVSDDRAIQLWDVSTGTLLSTCVDDNGSYNAYQNITGSGILRFNSHSKQFALLDSMSGKTKPLFNLNAYREGFINMRLLQNGQLKLFAALSPSELYTLDPQTGICSRVIEADWLKDGDVNLLYLPRKYQPEMIDLSNMSGRTTIVLGTSKGFFLVLRLPSPSTQSTDL
ncbi:hypothetical protein AOL_s00110g66 [Orbilia oligospora ATCC 24927]|uniref:NACHT domain-containing protein n=1 Tax=Arthrobotrys oligospora (strain ATCC 24927 / CBS 115.81 / DSM 1491) TaxID=756982 RepID=G1XKP6_ARTOA|nr:hypothetical protein AOL_s00110g66 [Orbilia oligospora ATCC 24927]EGX46242.1 hypothetical protein AOL_s00110g66 [Orbilia oligospora ATCC 24927]